MRSRYRSRHRHLRVAAIAAAVLLTAAPFVALDAAAQSRSRGGTSSDSTRARGQTTRTTPARTERTTPTRTERTTPTRTERTTPTRTEREGRGRVGSSTAPADRRSEERREAEARRRETERRAEELRRVEARRRSEQDHRRDDRRRYDRDWYRTAPSSRPAPRVVVRPGIHIDIDWPWEHRYERRWAPQYRYRQVVHFESTWRGVRQPRRLDVRTRYHERVRYASPARAEVDIYIDAFELYDNGRFVGEVDRIPNDLSRIRATIYRDGHVRFDREVFLVGDPRSGFEVISTPYYDGYVLDAYDRSHRIRVGRVDLRRERVVRVRYSRLFDPYDFNGHVPVSLLPEDAGWLFDYGYGSVSGRAYGDDRYGDRDYGGYDYYDDYYYGLGGSGVAAPGMKAAPRSESAAPALRLENDQTFETDRAGTIRLRREVELERVQ